MYQYLGGSSTGDQLVETTADLTVDRNQHVVARSTDAVFKVLTLPSSPAVGDRLRVTVPKSSLAPIALDAGVNPVQGLLQSNNQFGWVSPGTGTELIYTTGLGWVGDRNLLNLAYSHPTFFGGVEAGANNGAWATSPASLVNTLNLNPNSWSTTGSMDASSGSTEHFLVAWLGTSVVRSHAIGYTYARFELTRTAGSGNLSFDSYSFDPWLDWQRRREIDNQPIPASGSQVYSQQYFNLWPHANRAGFSLRKQSAGAYCDVRFGTLVLL